MSMGVPTGTWDRMLIVWGLDRIQPWEDATPIVEAGSDG
jgi:hypothetical protein